MKKPPSAGLIIGGKAYAFQKGLFGVNAEVTRKGFFGGISAQMLNNRKFLSGNETPCGWECENASLLTDKENSPCRSNYVRLCGGAIKQTSGVTFLKSGKEYEAKITAKAVFEGSSVTFGVTGYERTFTLDSGYKTLSFVFTPDHDGQAVFTVSADKDTDVFSVSLMPADNFYGMRRDVIEALKQIAPTSIRFPGGCCADHFDWKECLKPADLRTPFDGSAKDFMLRDTYDQECADISLNEFVMLCREVGAEPELTVSVILSDGEDARRLVEYCNGEIDTEYGKKRAGTGFKEPFDIKYFYVGNEIYYFGYEYRKDGVKAAKRTNEIVNAMRKADESIKICLGAVADEGLKQWSRDYVSNVDCKYDAASYHRYCGNKPENEDSENTVKKDIERSFENGFDTGLSFVCGELYKGVSIPVNVDEWNFSWGTDANNASFLSNVLEFHFFAKSYKKYGITDARFFMPVNEGMITVTGADCKVECAGIAFSLLHGHIGGDVVECTASANDLDVLCTDHGGHLFVSVVNRGNEEYEINANGYEITESTLIIPDAYSFKSNGFKIEKNIRPAVCGHGMTFLRLIHDKQ